MEADEDGTYTHFAHKDEFFGLLAKFLGCRLDVRSTEEEEIAEKKLLAELGAILDHYLPLPPLLDPYLQDIIPPLMQLLVDHFREITKVSSEAPYSNEERIARTGRLLQWITKVRGRKGVVTYFPSEVHHLPMLLKLFTPSPSGTPYHPSISPSTSWELRSILLLWLSLLMTIPFNLSAFDTQAPSTSISALISIPNMTTADQVRGICQPLLYKPSKEGEYAALTLARLFARPDCLKNLGGFLNWVEEELQSHEGDDAGLTAIFMTNVLAFLAILPTLLPSSTGNAQLEQLFTFNRDVIQVRLAESSNSAGSNSSLLRKMAVKAEGRGWIVRLSRGQHGKRERKRAGSSAREGSSKVDVLRSLDYRVYRRDEARGFGEFDPPEGFEDEIQSLIDHLSDKDTIVRYSAAKYLARLSELLPTSMSSQIVEAVIDTFQASDMDPVVMTDKGKVLDPGGGSNGDARWHGVCLALAEMARRGLVDGQILPSLLPWVIKALTFDIRKGAHSIGSNVRDAAAYLIWSLARATSPDQIRPFANEIAITLVSVACFDREVGIRRAASAAFQEHVGRMGLFPHGIDVLRKTDFFSVSVRRTASLSAAVDVAQYDEYRGALIDRLHDTTLRHWDPAIRSLAAQSLRMICGVLPEQTESQSARSVDVEIGYLQSVDVGNIHGAVVALTDLVANFHGRTSEADIKLKVLESLIKIRSSLWTSFAADMLLEVASNLVSATYGTDSSRNLGSEQLVKRIIELGLKSRKEPVQIAAANALGVISSFRPSGLKKPRFPQKRAFAIALGKVDYAVQASMRYVGMKALLDIAKEPSTDIETKKAAFESLAEVACRFEFDDQAFGSILVLVGSGLNDYSTDQRGDVGSWLRVSSCRGIARLIKKSSLYALPSSTLRDIFGCLVRLGLERLEIVRLAAYAAMQDIKPAIEGVADVVKVSDPRDTKALFSSLLAFVRVPIFAEQAVQGISSCIGGKSQDLSQIALGALLPLVGPAKPAETAAVFSALANIADANHRINRVFVPVVNTAFELLQSGIVSQGSEAGTVSSLTRLIELCARGIAQSKTIDRIIASMKLTIASLTVSPARNTAAGYIALYLGHEFPRIRTLAAEQLYLAYLELELDDEVLEAALLETNWIKEEGKGAAQDVQAMFAAHT